MSTRWIISGAMAVGGMACLMAAAFLSGTVTDGWHLFTSAPLWARFFAAGLSLWFLFVITFPSGRRS